MDRDYWHSPSSLIAHIEGSPAALRSRLKKKPDLLNAHDERGRGLIHLISLNHQFEPAHLKALLDHGFTVDQRDTLGNTPLHYVSKESVLTALLKHGAAMHARNALGYTPIHAAVAMGYIDLCPPMIAAGANINSKAANGDTPWDVKFGSFQEKELLALGAVSGKGTTTPTAFEKPRFTWFWSLLAGKGKAPQRLAALEQKLSSLTPQEVLIFSEHYENRANHARCRNVEALSEILSEGGSDDGMEDFVYWLVSRGKSFYDKALKNPELLASEDLTVDVEMSHISSLVSAVYGDEDATSNGSGIAFDWPDEPDAASEPWEDSQLKRAFPKLYKLKTTPR